MSRIRLHSLYHTNKEFYKAFLNAREHKEIHFIFCNEFFLIKSILEAI